MNKELMAIRLEEEANRLEACATLLRSGEFTIDSIAGGVRGVMFGLQDISEELQIEEEWYD